MVIGFRKVVQIQPLFFVKQEIIGDTLFLNGVFSLMAQTTKIRYHVQEVPLEPDQRITLDPFKIDLTNGGGWRLHHEAVKIDHII